MLFRSVIARHIDLTQLTFLIKESSNSKRTSANAGEVMREPSPLLLRAFRGPSPHLVWDGLAFWSLGPKKTQRRRCRWRGVGRRKPDTSGGVLAVQVPPLVADGADDG
jgi:hypothetical protein